MEMIQKLKVTDFMKEKEDFSFQSTKEIPSLSNMIGQDIAIEAFDFALAIEKKDYHIYLSGENGTGKMTYACRRVEEWAKKKAVPKDLCYVYDFQNSRIPKALFFSAGQGIVFEEEMQELMEQIQYQLDQTFHGEIYEEMKQEVRHHFDEERNECMQNMSKIAKQYDFEMKNTSSGIYFMAVIDGQTVGEEEYEALTFEKQQEIEEQAQIIQEQVAPQHKRLKEIEKLIKEQLEDLEYEVGLFAIGKYVVALQEKYVGQENVILYLQDVLEDILNHIPSFFEYEEEVDDTLSALFPSLSKKPVEDILLKYQVNVVVDHSESEHAPVVIANHLSFMNLIGELEYDSENGNISTDFMKIKSGFLQQANGGYLILSAQDILTTPYAWEVIRRTLKTKQFNMDGLKEQFQTPFTPILKPEAIPIDLKVILVGSEDSYDILAEFDEEFQTLFKMKITFDSDMEYTKEHVYQIAQFIKTFIEREETKEFDKEAIVSVVRYASRLAESQNKLTACFHDINRLLCEASTWADLEDADIIQKKHIKKAIEKKEIRNNLYERKLRDMIKENVILIDTKGKKIGQINGLSVMQIDEHTFGSVSRITATTYVGKSGLVNIEKEAEMSGETHTKGVQIIHGWLGQTYAQTFPLSLSSRICFEQNYGGIDGDSASSTELYCVLSSLSDLPIRQDIAVTGSVNQMGDIQAIGGVTHKVEGFYEICKQQGLTGEQGVLIPRSNISDLVLKEELIEAIEAEQFHLYAIDSIEDGMELLMEKSVGEKKADGTYEADSIHDLVMKKLKCFYEVSAK